ncbi:MAG TPA: hypothetical protein VGG39_14480 [Polyangiaceae bacterium]
MRRFLTSMFVAGVFSLGMAFVSTDASAAGWQRYPGALCQGDYNSNPTLFGSDVGTGGLEIVGASGGIIHTQVVCPWIDTSTVLDTSITSISADMYNPTATNEAASSLSMEACVYSGWTRTCGATSSSPAITAGGHSGASITDISAWTGDTGNGYAYVLLNEGNSSSNYLGGFIYNY